MAAVSILNGTTQGKDIFLHVQNVIYSLEFIIDQLVSVTTNKARNMTGENIGLQTVIINEMKFKELSPSLTFYCIIHQHALCAKIISWDLIMKDVVSIINFLRCNGLNHRLFQNFFVEMNADYGDVLYYTPVIW